ncbi:MAG: NADH-quinone oxidoreductase subunit G [Syntrophus sp. SKADARSKE-3]|nr:NADH-quinone oxidoreductase subunit G [Syntrophus sp. SKADARSKE-3]
MATIYIDNQPYDVEEGQNLLHACLSLGLYIPHFCWHPALNSVGACRLCAVKLFKDKEDRKGKLAMSCMTPAAQGTWLSIDDPEARAFRAANIEWLMTNHPHDCAVCDEGGECHLQDMTVMTGHVYRRFRFPKRTYENQDLGPFVNHEMNRCIQCYRCVRFYRDYAGGRDLNVMSSHNEVYFGRHEDGPLENEFSGNLVEVCPTGVFTDKTLKRHYARKWDMQTAPSICIHCGVGCNTIAGAREGILRRIRNRFNPAVNGYFLCDRGRFGYEFVNSERRIRRPFLIPINSHIEGIPEEISRTNALQWISSILSPDNSWIIGVGSPRASMEANFALQTFVGKENFFSGLGLRDQRLIELILDIMTNGPAHTPSLAEMEQSDAVFVLGEDVPDTAPRVALSLHRAVREQPITIARKLNIPDWDDNAVREVIQDKRGPLFIATPAATRLDDLATATAHNTPAELALLGFAVAHAIHAEAPAVSGLSEEMASLAESIARTLCQAERPLVISGTALRDETLIQAAANVACALCAIGKKASLYYCMPECNSLGIGLLGGKPLDEIIEVIEALEGKSSGIVLIAENDLFRRMEASFVECFRTAAKHLIVIDHVAGSTTAMADLVLPASTFAEGSGTLISAEGRAQRYYRALEPDGDVQESWRWIHDIMVIVNDPRAESLMNLDAITDAMSETVPGLSTLKDFWPNADFRIAGQKIPRQPHRFSGRTAMTAHLNVHEPKPPDDQDSALAFSMEGSTSEPPLPLIMRYWAPGLNSDLPICKNQHNTQCAAGKDHPEPLILKPGEAAAPAFFATPPLPAKAPPQGKILVVPLYHVFGSEELSALAPGIAQLSPEPYLALHPDDAGTRNMQDSQVLRIVLNGQDMDLPIRLDPSLPFGVAGMPAGLAGLSGIILPEWGTLLTDERKSEAQT